MVEGFEDAAELFEAGALAAADPPDGLDDVGGVLTSGGVSSIGSSLTGVASPLSSDASDSSPVLFFFTFFVFRTLALDLVPVEEEEVGGW